MFQSKDNVINITVDEEHSVDELVELIKPRINSDRVLNGTRRLVYVADACHSCEAFQLAMSLSKDLGLAVDLLHSSNNASNMPELIPEIITMNAAGISHIHSQTSVDLPEAITHHIDKLFDISAVLIESTLFPDHVLKYLEGSLCNRDDNERPILIALNHIV